MSTEELTGIEWRFSEWLAVSVAFFILYYIKFIDEWWFKSRKCFRIF